MEDAKEIMKKWANQETTWYPTRIESFRNSFKLAPKFPNGADTYDIQSNLSYNFQSLQYILLQIDGLVLSEVLKKNLIKSFVITGMSIIEVSFYSILTKNQF
ncbi:hypothetical protein [Eupransor demetentiae]|uniref:Uncharacterized protein n=1 Tax=Eupransor demetentiae TaxID=3109584 RepID=A0ABM9N431_9LACO|nr:hypothetical protein R54876_GBNLAHCA_00481 [Lactobacillaceae bacterium LMG 33000]